ncbi:MAG TPA: hypothetical protein VF597_04170 [Candidatus Saccharimonadales bacterium]|jgi:hypothetical protein
MQTTFEPPTLEQRRQHDYEQYRAYSRYQLERDEITAAGEFLQTHNVSHIECDRDEHGLYIDDDAAKLYLADIGESSQRAYERRVRLQPELAWQVERVRLENEHIAAASQLAPGSLQVVVSDCPVDELTRLGRNEFGYQRERGLSFLQVFQADSDGRVHIYGHSFDRADKDGIAAMYEQLGKRFDRSEWALAQPVHITDAAPLEPTLLIERLLAAYDGSLQRTQGGTWFAGREHLLLRIEGNTFVQRQVDLVQAHCDILEQLEAASPEAQQQRYDFILAIRDRFEGKRAASDADTSAGGEMSGAGDAGRSSGEEVNFCGNTIGAVPGAAEQLRTAGFQLLKKDEWRRGDCQACLSEWVMVGACSICRSCERADDNGTDLMKLRARKLAERVTRQHHSAGTSTNDKGSFNRTVENKTDTIRHRYGEYAVLSSQIAIGGVTTQVRDRRTGEVISDLVS